MESVDEIIKRVGENRPNDDQVLLSNCNLTSGQLEALCHKLRKNTHIKSVIIRHNNFSTIKPICDLMSDSRNNNININYVDLAENSLSLEDMDDIAFMLGDNTGWFELHLNNCNITNDHLHRLCVGLKNNLMLKGLVLHNNPFDSHGLHELLQVVEKHPTLANLYINTHINSDDLIEIGTMLQYNKSLTRISLGTSEELSLVSCDYFGKSLALNTKLCNLSIFDLTMSANGVLCMTSHLPDNNNILMLILPRGTDLTNDDVDQLISHLDYNKGIELMNVNDIQISRESLNKLQVTLADCDRRCDNYERRQKSKVGRFTKPSRRI